MDESDASTVQATATSFKVIQALRELDGAGVTEIADHLGLPKSTAHKHLHTLAQLGYVDNDGGTYELGLPFAGFGQYVQGNSPLFQAVQPAVEHLTETTEEVAGLFVERGGYGFDVYQVSDEADHEAAESLSPYLHSTAPGKAILAGLPDEQVDAIVDEHDLPALTEQTITSRSELEKELSRIRDRGIAFDRAESREGIRGVGIPIDYDGVAAAVYVVGPQQRLTGKWFNENIPGIVVSSVNTVEQRLRELD